MMAAIVHTFSLTSTRYLHNLRHFLYIMSRFFFIGLHIANVVTIEFYRFSGLEAVEGARALSTFLGREIRPVLG
jgi:hypothetical protein